LKQCHRLPRRSNKLPPNAVLGAISDLYASHSLTFPAPRPDQGRTHRAVERQARLHGRFGVRTWAGASWAFRL